jgi:hypothetical protein
MDRDRVERFRLLDLACDENFNPRRQLTYFENPADKAGFFMVMAIKRFRHLGAGAAGRD